MNRGMMRFLAVANVILAVSLVGSAIWLYGREHDTRRMERQIRTLERARLLEEETIRRLEIEWQRLRNPMRLERLARLKLNLLPPDPTAVLKEGRVLALLPMRPPPAEPEGVSEGARDALSDLAARAAGQAENDHARADAPQASVPAPARQDDALGGLIRGVLPDGGMQQ